MKNILKRFNGRDFLISCIIFLTLSIPLDWYVGNFQTEKIQEIRFWILYLLKVVVFGLIMSFAVFYKKSNHQNEKY